MNDPITDTITHGDCLTLRGDPAASLSGGADRQGKYFRRLIVWCLKT